MFLLKVLFFSFEFQNQGNDKAQYEAAGEEVQG